MKIINIYLIAINVFCFLLMGFDKLQAILKRKRIPECTLLTLSILGGTLGTTIAIFTFRHKIRKTKFLLLIPLTMIYIAYYIYNIYI